MPQLKLFTNFSISRFKLNQGVDEKLPVSVNGNRANLADCPIGQRLHADLSCIPKAEERAVSIVYALNDLSAQFEQACTKNQYTVDKFDGFLKNTLLPTDSGPSMARDLAQFCARDLGSIMTALADFAMNADSEASQKKAQRLTMAVDALHEYLQPGRQLLTTTREEVKRIRPTVEKHVGILAEQDRVKAQRSAKAVIETFRTLLTQMQTDMEAIGQSLKSVQRDWSAESARDLMQGEWNKGPQLTAQERSLPDLKDENYCKANLLALAYGKPPGAPDAGSLSPRLYATFNIEGQEKHLVFDGRSPTKHEFRGSELKEAMEGNQFKNLEDLMRQGSQKFDRLYARSAALGIIALPLNKLRRNAPDQMPAIITTVCNDAIIKPVLEKIGINEADIEAELYSGRY